MARIPFELMFWAAVLIGAVLAACVAAIAARFIPNQDRRRKEDL